MNQNTANQSNLRKRPTIGFMIRDEITFNFDLPIWAALEKSVQQNDVNLITFMQYPVWYSQDGVDLNTCSYQQINRDNLDGMVSFEIGLPWVSERLKHFYDAPNVAINFPVKNFPCITVDQDGIRYAVEHLIKVHGKKQILFINGNKGNVEAEARLESFSKTMRAHNLPVDSSLIYYGNFGDMHSASIIIDEVLTKKHLKFDAVVCANDIMAASAIKALEKHGLSVPHDIPVTGFDDEIRAKYSQPPLSTVQVPFGDMITEGTERLLRMINGEHIPAGIEKFPSRLIIRQSCGCLPDAIKNAAISAEKKSISFSKSKNTDLLFSKLDEVFGRKANRLPKDWKEKLYQALSTSLSEKSPDQILKEFDALVKISIEKNISIDDWQDVLSLLRAHFANGYRRNQQSLEDLFGQTRIYLGNMAENYSRRINLDQEAFSGSLMHTIEAIMSTFTMDGFLAAVCSSIPSNLPVSGVYIALYEESNTSTENAKLILAYDKTKGRMNVDENESEFLSKDILPAQYFPKNRRFHFVVAPLYFQGKNLGHVVFETQAVGTYFASLQKIMAGALQGVLLSNQRTTLINHIAETADNVAESATQLKTIMDNTGSSISQISQSVEQISEGANQQAKAVSNNVLSAEKMASISQSIAEEADQGNAFAQQVLADAEKGVELGIASMNGMDEIRQSVTDAVEKVGQMRVQSGNIQSIVETIEDITSQTNLLALNAAIEAARAGEHGRGFAVVASEVRKLAEKSNQSTQEIAALIKEIQRVIQEVVDAMSISDEQVSEGVDRAKESNLAINGIMEAAKYLFDQVNSISKGADELAEQSTEIAGSIDEIASVTEENTAATEEVSASIFTINEQMRDVVNMTAELNNTAQQMKALVE
jgi:methyl-accepting chemotaxis protein/DNA-binding LacI/PurR family transcriptional regulator